MSRHTLQLTEPLLAYLTGPASREDELLRALRAETAALPEANMQISPEQGQLLHLLVRLVGARKALEIGVFTGYSSVVIARALGPEGHLLALDVSEAWTSVAKGWWARAGLTERIDLRLAPAAQTLATLRAGGQDGTFDFVFLDADKASYGHYYEQALALLRPGGLLVVDNTLWGGRVAEAGTDDPDTVAIRSLNERMRADPAIDFALVPVGDGVSLALKRG